MEKYYRILFYLNETHCRTQRALAKGVDMSLGQINALLRQLETEQYLIRSDSGYTLTKKGKEFLELQARQNQEKKLSFENASHRIHTAVILAAGANPNFSCPVGMLKIDGIPLIEHLVRMLTSNGIDTIYLVTGFEKEQYEQYFQGRNLTLIANPRYKWSGTMESLSLVKDYIREDFLLIESNLIFEETAITALLSSDDPNGLILTVPSGSRDEAYVELGKGRSLFRISKDIRQLNRIDGEMIGVSRISLPLFQKMLDYFSENKNPMLNYEYVVENIGRIYEIRGILIDDMAWTVIEDSKLYHKASKLVWPRIQTRAKKRRETYARDIFLSCMNRTQKQIEDFRLCGGMTNTNYYVKSHGEEYILRIPGACTNDMINRESEQLHGARASDLGINVPISYFDSKSGIKISKYIPDAITLNGRSARLEHNLAKTARILSTLHTSDFPMYQDFSVRKEYEKYKRLIAESGGVLYPEFSEIDPWFYTLLDRLDQIGTERIPCHNDLVPENLIVDRDGRMYLIDWEYSGYNDPMWDLASHFVECEFSQADEELFLLYYFGETVPEHALEKILIYKTLQDILWSAWTVLKERNGENFGSYGQDRLHRAICEKAEYQKRYGLEEI